MHVEVERANPTEGAGRDPMMPRFDLTRSVTGHAAIWSILSRISSASWAHQTRRGPNLGGAAGDRRTLHCALSTMPTGFNAQENG